jgi:hypothetical protein
MLRSDDPEVLARSSGESVRLMRLWSCFGLRNQKRGSDR